MCLNGTELFFGWSVTQENEDRKLVSLEFHVYLDDDRWLIDIQYLLYELRYLETIWLL